MMLLSLIDTKMTDAQEVLSEKILDDLFYPHFDALSKPVE